MTLLNDTLTVTNSVADFGIYDHRSEQIWIPQKYLLLSKKCQKFGSETALIDSANNIIFLSLRREKENRFRIMECLGWEETSGGHLIQPQAGPPTASRPGPCPGRF